MSWRDAPSFEDVKGALQKRASLSAQIRVAEYELQEIQAQIAKVKPRDTASKIIGYDEHTKEELQGINHRLIDLRISLDEVEADIKFHDYWKDMFKAVSYREKL